MANVCQGLKTTENAFPANKMGRVEELLVFIWRKGQRQYPGLSVLVMAKSGPSTISLSSRIGDIYGIIQIMFYLFHLLNSMKMHLKNPFYTLQMHICQLLQKLTKWLKM